MRYGHHRSEYVVFSLFTFARRATLAAAIHLRAAAEIARAQPVGNLVSRPALRDHGRSKMCPNQTENGNGPIPVFVGFR